MPEQQQRARLARMRRLATGLLLTMAVLFVAARLLQRHWSTPWLAPLAAFAEAAMIGGLADWFAVTALFRHPLGLPIPHTAIIVRNQQRIGASVAGFLEHNFLTAEVLQAELVRLDIAGALARWLSRRPNRQAIAAQLAGAVPAVLRLVEDEAAGRLLRGALAGALEQVRLAPLLAQLLSTLSAGGQHMLLLERLLGIVARALDQNRPYIRQKVHENSPRWLPKAIDEKFFERLMEGVHASLQEMQQEDSEWRARFQAATDELIERLATSPDYEAWLHALVEASLNHPLLSQYAGQVWRHARQALLDDTQAPDSRLAAALERMLRTLARAVLDDHALRDRINSAARGGAADVIAAHRRQIAGVVRRVIQSWDGATMSRKFELQVGSDLQYIRINGTLVGGLVGLLLYGLSQML